MESNPDSKLESEAPVVIDLGKKRRKQIKKLRKGSGKLMDRVATCIQELKSSGSISQSAQPVIIVVKQKKKKRMGFLSM